MDISELKIENMVKLHFEGFYKLNDHLKIEMKTRNKNLHNINIGNLNLLPFRKQIYGTFEAVY